MSCFRTNPLGTEKKNVVASSEKVEYAAGTTWVFDDFSTADGELRVGFKESTAGAVSKGEGVEDPGDDEKDLDNFMEDMEGIVDI